MLLETKRHLFSLWHIHHIFHVELLQVWYHNFYDLLFCPIWLYKWFSYLFGHMLTDCLWSWFPNLYHVAYDIMIINFGKAPLTSNPSWLKRRPIGWSPTHSPFNSKIHLQSVLIFINLVWHLEGACEAVIHKVCTMLNFYLHWVVL